MASNGNPTVNRLALIGIPMAIFVLGLKTLAWWLTGSVALLSDALESTVNVVAAFVAWGAIRYASRPADATHPFGHHKAEYVSAVIEGVLIVVAALLILQEAIPKLWAPKVLEQPALGLGVNFLAGVVNVVWATILIRAGRQHRSPALTADGHHIMADVVTSAGVLVGLILVVLTGYAILDPVMAILVAIHIVFQGWKIIMNSVNGLMDHAIESEEEAAIKQAIAVNADGSLGVHDLKTRRAGQAIFVEFHLVVPARMAVGDAHDICDRLEAAIEAVHQGAQVAIHVEPETEMAHGIKVKVEKAKA
ncbi:cation diffusion facilitator family transporter [Rhizobium subbaraonis]|uniref:Protein p34 n=1 Tax=Rhizobium subbaraonis TaxID=908946 RepID=A0A285UKA6_9HYPH|nr:cation diffusion facilitator family transporter [Rhizobium subbaraonis]SOC42203.1 cation diffusion facilitator family transporter [Rhizobium subbaraonis]